MEHQETTLNAITSSRGAIPPIATRRINRIIRRIGRALFVLLALLIGLALLGASYEAIMAAGDTERYPPPGQLVDVGGYTLHIDCEGDNGPTIVLVTGLGGSSLLWSRVQPALARSTRVCVYDRAGLGWSDPSDGPRTPAAVADELHTLLANAGVPGPYVLVGASVGGKYIRLFAEQYPNEVAGMVLVDARHESVDASLTPDEQAAGLASAQRDGKLYWWLGRLGIMRLFGARLAAASSPGAATLPPDIGTLLMVQASRRDSIDAMLGESAGMTMDDARLRAARPLGALPLIVLAADSSIAHSQDWSTAQEAQARLSRNSQLIVVPQSSHFVSFDQPQAVADAIEQVVESARTGETLVP
jgi:pimeloyl-ACP methyl ester carboxylesterase